jgi:hypothetical protein
LRRQISVQAIQAQAGRLLITRYLPIRPKVQTGLRSIAAATRTCLAARPISGLSRANPGQPVIRGLQRRQ